MSPPDRPPRLPGLDALRGVALLAMVAYHAAWDLSFLGLIATDVAADPAWRRFAQSVAAAFLLIAGISLALASRAGTELKRMLRRVGVIAAAAAAVSAATYAVLPGQGVYFGILHCIALASLIGIALRRAPAWLLLGLAGLALVLPHFAAGPGFDAPAWYWLGLSTTVPPAPDYVPLLPWCAAVLCGMAIGRALPFPRPPGAPPAVAVRLLAAAGRRSLAIYLLHQPILLGVLLAAMPLVGSWRQPPAWDWAAAWRAGCIGAGRASSDCESELACLVKTLAAEGRGGEGTATLEPAEAALRCRPSPSARP
ncbi:MAG: DUF1624 domain-containing protein [Acetobacteraceae bacterium]|nr:DUF1624 domain-containing protein [Acetobacteraceae bacterium]